jgi:hypothetical protein
MHGSNVTAFIIFGGKSEKKTLARTKCKPVVKSHLQELGVLGG